MKYLMSINEFFKFHAGKYTPDKNFDTYKGLCKRDFDVLYTDDDWKKILQILENDCGQFLDEIKEAESIVFRGVKGSKEEVNKGIWKKASRSDRYTLDMRQDVSKEFDNLFAQKFDITIRSMGVFATKQPLNAQGYTKNIDKQDGFERKRTVNFLFFPIGEYRYFWNPKIMDLYSDVEMEHWYGDYDFIGDEYFDEEHLMDRWWEIYGEPGQKRDQWSWCRGGGKGQYSYKGIETGLNQIPRILGEVRENPDKYSVSPDIEQEDLKKDLIWIPEMTIDDYGKVMADEIKNDAISHMQQIVQGYQEDGLKEIGVQEITFTCKEYYLVDDAFLHKMIEWLES